MSSDIPYRNIDKDIQFLRDVFHRFSDAFNACPGTPKAKVRFRCLSDQIDWNDEVPENADEETKHVYFLLSCLRSSNACENWSEKIQPLFEEIRPQCPQWVFWREDRHGLRIRRLIERFIAKCHRDLDYFEAEMEKRKRANAARKNEETA